MKIALEENPAIIQPKPLIRSWLPAPDLVHHMLHRSYAAMTKGGTGTEQAEMGTA